MSLYMRFSILLRVLGLGCVRGLCVLDIRGTAYWVEYHSCPIAFQLAQILAFFALDETCCFLELTFVKTIWKIWLQMSGAFGNIMDVMSCQIFIKFGR